MKKILLLVTFSLSLSAAIQMENIQQIRTALGLDRYPYRKDLSGIKIAVIDNGFMGFEQNGKYLPTSAVLVNKYDPEFIKKYNLGDPNYALEMAQTEHGRIMAQIVWGVTGSNEDGPKFYLLNANGITNFRRAVRYAIEEKVDIILYSQNRECCGNFDGGGFLNAIVNQATDAGILWINAAGNYGGRVYNGDFRKNTSLRIKSHLDENPAQVILTWNSSGSEETSGTEKNLDLYLYDEKDREVAKSELVQVLKKDKLGEGETFLPRERIRYVFSKNQSGYYRLVVKAKSNNFGPGDKIRIVVIPEKGPVVPQNSNKRVDAVEFIDATKGGEIMTPADNPHVITVGDLGPYSANGPTVDGRLKPEIILENSAASFTDGTSTEGTSNGAAYFAGIVAILKSYRADLDRYAILSFPKKKVFVPKPVSFTEFSSLHREILRFVDGLAEESPVLIGRFADGHYALGMRKSPYVFLGEFCGISSDSGRTELYLAYNPRSSNQRVECFTRSVDEEDKYPWERTNRFQRQDFVEVRQVNLLGGVNSGTPSQGVWLTPTPEELFNNR